MGSKTNHKKLAQIEIFNGGHLENMQINHVPGVIWPGTFFWDSAWPVKAVEAKNDLLELLGGSLIDQTIVIVCQ